MTDSTTGNQSGLAQAAGHYSPGRAVYWETWSRYERVAYLFVKTGEFLSFFLCRVCVVGLRFGLGLALVVDGDRISRRGVSGIYVGFPTCSYSHNVNFSSDF